MQLVTAVVRPHTLESIKDALHEMGVSGLTVSETRGFGRQGGQTETYRGAEYTIEFIPKAKIEILVDEADSDKVVETIASVARTGRIGDGKIWVTPVATVMRIRTGELGPDAL